MKPAEVRTATPADREAMIDTLLLSFSADPCVRYIFSKPRDFMAGWPPFVMAMGGRGLEHGTAFVAEDAAAVSLWLQACVEPDLETMLGVLAGVITPEKGEVLAKVGEQIRSHHPAGPHWYLAAVGVDPARQGEGLGSAMIKEGLRLCDQQGLPAYLESSNPRNIPLYERHGFEVIGLVQPDDYPPLYPMLRPAR
ncbi:GNAT family N-acetyltransferase [Phenylobacterium sp.]|uniref:GNAT family N-acetyltransferase n=1 Tax=Phenylobacterium sp. TaxID=1871053 RepID=UPI0025EE3893|nr:GNAT family N-acetyltransferase [Phenylobacterium sp.]